MTPNQIKKPQDVWKGPSLVITTLKMANISSKVCFCFPRNDKRCFIPIFPLCGAEGPAGLWMKNIHGYFHSCLLHVQNLSKPAGSSYKRGRSDSSVIDRWYRYNGLLSPTVDRWDLKAQRPPVGSGVFRREEGWTVASCSRRAVSSRGCRWGAQAARLLRQGLGMCCCSRRRVGMSADWSLLIQTESHSLTLS